MNSIIYLTVATITDTLIWVAVAWGSLQIILFKISLGQPNPKLGLASVGLVLGAVYIAAIIATLITPLNFFLLNKISQLLKVSAFSQINHKRPLFLVSLMLTTIILIVGYHFFS